MAETIREMISEEKVDERIRELGRQISEDYAGKQIHLICVLKGGVFFMCELAKRITVPVSMDYVCRKLRRRNGFERSCSYSERSG